MQGLPRETFPDSMSCCVQLLLAKSNGLAVQSGSGDDSPLLARGHSAIC